LKAILTLVCIFVGAIALMLFYFTKMPGESPAMSTAPMTEEETASADRMKDTCEMLSHQIGQRSTAKIGNVELAREYIEGKLAKLSLHPKEKVFTTRGFSGVNFEAEIEGTGTVGDVLVLGAHYDTEAYSPGGGDNASGCAVLLEVAKGLAGRVHNRAIDIVFFDFGSSRFAGSDDAGSHYWAESARRDGRKIAAMLSFDSIGRFSDEPGSQGGPFPLSVCYPSKGNFLMFSGDLGTRDLVQACIQTWRGMADFPCEGVTLPGFIPGVGSSDHFAFRQNGWPAIVVSDTGPYRSKEYGTPEDTADHLNYPVMSKAASRLVKLVERLAQTGAAGMASLN
jgi:Zn-dependent M28 family amino/carboxypeptidase